MDWNNSKYNLITILGPTASGKTSVATHLAYNLRGEIISGDSRQLYRGMDLGTGKDIHEYSVNGVAIPYHLIDIFDAGYKCNVYEYQNKFIEAHQNILSRGVTPILCGGSGLYIEAAIKGYKLIEVPENLELRAQMASKSYEELVAWLASMKKLHNTTDIDTRKRLERAIEIEAHYASRPAESTPYPDIKSIVFGVRFPRYVQRERITQRLRQRLNDGMVEEVKQIINSGVLPADLTYYGLEYKWITQYVTGEISYDDMFNGLNTAIHQFAKRQMTWFRRMERNGVHIHWIDGDLPIDTKIDLIVSTLEMA